MLFLNRSLLFVALIFLPFCALSQQGTVLYISDGDTFHFVNSEIREKIKVKLAEVDCPESTQSYGLEAKQFVLENINNKIFQLQVSSVEQYGRSIAKVNFDDIKDLANELVRYGIAWHYKRYSNSKILAELKT